MRAKKKQRREERESAGAPKRVWPRYAAQIAALWIAAFAAYSNSFEAGLVFDNASIIGQDPRIRAATPETIGLILTKEYWYPATTSGLYRPLATLSYLWNYSVLGEGPHPAGYHLVNLALHDLNILLVYGLGLAILGSAAPAFALAALWAVHPLLTESVTNIVGRADLLAAFGVLAGLLCHVRGRVYEGPATGRKRVAWLAGLAAAQTIGIFSKESAAVLPALMALYDFTWRKKETWRDRALPYLVLLVPFGAFFYLRSQIDTHLIVHFGENALAGAGFWTQRITAVKVIGKFLWLFLWPVRLSADYSFNAVPLFSWRVFEWEDFKALIALAACAGLIAAAIRFRSSKPLLFFVGFFLITLAPSSNLVLLIGSIMAERFMYLPALALCGCVVVAVQMFGRPMDAGRPWLKWVALGAVCLALGVRTYARNFDWRDGISLWSSAVAAYPESARAHFGLGVALMEKSEVASGVAEFETALRIRPDYANAHIGLGNALARMPGRTADAIVQFQEALRLDPNVAEAHYNLANALARSPERTEDAIAEWQRAIRVQPDFAEAHYNLATAYSQLPGRLPDAIVEYQAALRIRPDYAEAHNNLASVYAQLPGRLPEAVSEYQAALRIRPDYAEAHGNLGDALARMPGRMAEAIDQYEELVRLRPDSGEAHYRLGMALLQAPGRMKDAIAELEAALRINPDPRGRQMIDELRARAPGGVNREK
ncbi:MAG TPA: tetratricopeptide repeat protein [Bryobacteraceae bacterium]|nr:tetratricopeptide repeat protein [Bryobacteraceae bacterium]